MSLRDIQDARSKIRSWIKETRLKESKFLSNLCSASVSLKLENLQTTHSFKIRGALNKLLNLTDQEKKCGVITASAGNHGQAVAWVAEILDIPIKIVVPENTPKVKIKGIIAHNVKPILFGNIYDEAERQALKIAREQGLTYISPYNDNKIIAGQGTIGLEILEEMPELDTIIVPVGGGGLISGISIAAKSIKPGVHIIGVQSKASPAMYECLRAGRVIDVQIRPSIADGLAGGLEEGSMTLDIVKTNVDCLLLVKEETITESIRLLWQKEGQITEGAGAIAIAPMVEHSSRFKGKTIAAVISGGNIDEKEFRQILN